MNKKVRLAISLLFCFSLLIIIFNGDASKRTLVLSAGKSTGTYYAFSRGIVEAILNVHKKHIRDISSEGSFENTMNLVNGKADLALIQEDVLRYIISEAKAKNDKNLQECLSKLRIIMVAYEEHVHILVNRNRVKDSNNDGLITIDDLDGKKINVGSRGSGTYITAMNILKSYKFSKKTRLYTNSSRDGIRSVVYGKYDAGFYVTGVPNKVFQGIDLTQNVELIRVSIKGENKDSFYDHSGTMSSYYYDFMQGQDIHDTIKVQALLVAKSGYDDSRGTEFLDFLYRNVKNYGAIYHPKWYDVTREKSISYLGKFPDLWMGSSKKYFDSIKNENKRNASVNFYVGSRRGSYAKIAADITPLIKEHLGIRPLIVNSAGSMENARKVTSGIALFSIIQDDVLYQLKKSNEGAEIAGRREALPIKKIMPLYKEYLHLIVNTSKVKDINGDGRITIADLKNKKVAVCEKNSGTFATAGPILKSYNFTHGEEPALFFDKPEIAFKKMVSGEYDAMFKVTAPPYDLLKNLKDTSNLRLVSALPEKGGVSSGYVYQKGKVSLYPGLAGNGEETVYVHSVLVSSTALGKKKVDRLIEQIYQQKIGFKNYKKWGRITRKAGVKYYLKRSYGWNDYAANYYLSQVSD